MKQVSDHLNYKQAQGSSQALFGAAPPVYPSGMREIGWVSCLYVSFSLGPGISPSASPGTLNSVAAGFSDLASGLRDVSILVPPQYPAKKRAFSGPGPRQEPFSSGPRALALGVSTLA